MATYTEIRDLFNDSELLNRIEVATIIFAQNLAAGTPTIADKKWIASVMSIPVVEGKKMLLGVLAANSAASVANIQSSTDAQIQANVDSFAPILIDALSGV